MPSPFPGVDPFVNQTDCWPRFRRMFLSELVRHLNEWLPENAVATLGCRPPELCERSREPLSGSSDCPAAHEPAVSRETTAVLTTDPEIDLHRNPTTESVPAAAPQGYRPHPANRLVLISRQANPEEILSVIEVVTDAHKRPGTLQDVYAASQRCVLDSSANLIEIDLRIAGDRPIPTFFLEEFLAELMPEPEFLVLVSRSWKRHTAGLGADFDGGAAGGDAHGPGG